MYSNNCNVQRNSLPTFPPPVVATSTAWTAQIWYGLDENILNVSSHIRWLGKLVEPLEGWGTTTQGTEAHRDRTRTLWVELVAKQTGGLEHILSHLTSIEERYNVLNLIGGRRVGPAEVSRLGVRGEDHHHADSEKGGWGRCGPPLAGAAAI